MINADRYGSGHPWYYKLGGAVKSPKVIMMEVQARGYKGYKADDIKSADRMPEPKRSQVLRQFRVKFMDDLKRDLSRYRIVARELHRHRKTFSLGSNEICCDSVHESVALKHNHLFNDFAHVILLDALLSKQPDLFD